MVRFGSVRPVRFGFSCFPNIYIYIYIYIYTHICWLYFHQLYFQQTTWTPETQSWNFIPLARSSYCMNNQYISWNYSWWHYSQIPIDICPFTSPFVQDPVQKLRASSVARAFVSPRSLGDYKFTNYNFRKKPLKLKQTLIFTSLAVYVQQRNQGLFCWNDSWSTCSQILAWKISEWLISNRRGVRQGSPRGQTLKGTSP